MIISDLFILFIHLNIYEYGKWNDRQHICKPSTRTTVITCRRPCNVRLVPSCVV